MPEWTKRFAAVVCDLIGGASVGLLLGILIGLSTTPVVSIVITGVVALLGAFFGLSDKLAIAPSQVGARRLIGFALSAAAFTLVGVWLRTHEALAPSIADQKTALRALGYADQSKEQTEMLRYLRYGLLPAGVTATKDHLPDVGVLYANRAPSMCDDLSRARAPADVAEILGQADTRLKDVAGKIRNLGPERQGDAADVAKSILCPGN